MNHIGVLRLSSLGDTILITPVLEALKTGYPDSDLLVLTREPYAPVFKNNPHVDSVISLNTRGAHRGLPGLYRYIRELDGISFDLVLDLHANLRSHLITLALHSERTIRYGKRHWIRWSMVHMKRFRPRARHTVDLYLDTINRLGVKPVRRRPRIYLEADEIGAASRMLDEHGITGGGNLVGIHVGAKSRVKQWPADFFSRIVEQCKEKSLLPVLFGGGTDERYLEEITKPLTRSPVVFRKLPLRQLFALIDQCSVLLCHDSGPMHAAVALDVPVVALYGPTHPRLGFWPLGDDDRIITANAECSPCSLHGTKPCSRSEKVCVEGITPEEVLEAVKIRLSGGKEG